MKILQIISKCDLIRFVFFVVLLLLISFFPRFCRVVCRFFSFHSLAFFLIDLFICGKAESATYCLYLIPSFLFRLIHSSPFILDVIFVSQLSFQIFRFFFSFSFSFFLFFFFFLLRFFLFLTFPFALCQVRFVKCSNGELFATQSRGRTMAHSRDQRRGYEE